MPLKAGQFETSRVSGHEPEGRSGFRNRANDQRVEFGPAKKDAGIESSTRGASSDRAARGFGADSPGMGPQGRISVPAESAGDLGGPTSRSDIFLDDVSVSRRHVELRWEKDDFHDTPPHSQASGIAPKAPSTSSATATTFRSCSAAATRRRPSGWPRATPRRSSILSIHAPPGDEEKGTRRATASRPLWCGD